MPHKAPVPGKYFGVSGHAGAFKSGHYITVPEANFSTKTTLTPHVLPAHDHAAAGKYFGVSGHAGAFKSGHYITVPEANFSTKTTLQPHQAAAAQTGKYFGVGGHAGSRTSGYITVGEADLNHATAPVKAAMASAAAVNAGHAAHGANHGGKYFGTSGHAGERTSGHVTVPEANHIYASTHVQNHAGLNKATASARAAADKLAPTHNPNAPHKYFGVSGHAESKYGGQGHYITVNEANPALAPHRGMAASPTVKAAAALANKLAPYQTAAAGHKYFGVSGHAGTKYSSQYITVNEADNGAHSGTVKAAAQLAGKLAPGVHLTPNKMAVQHGAPAANHKYFGVGGQAGTYRSGVYITTPESGGAAAQHNFSGTVKAAAALANHAAPATHAAPQGKYFGVAGHTGTKFSNQYVTVPEASAGAHASTAGSVKAAAALANQLAPPAHAGATAVKYSGVSGHAGTFKSPQIVTVPEADGHASMAGSVKAAAALANPAHGGAPALKYSGVSGHAGTFTSPQTVAVAESNGHANGTVKFAAGLVHKAEASGMKSFGKPGVTFKYSGVSGHAGTFKSPSTVTVPEAQGYRVAHSLAAHAPQPMFARRHNYIGHNYIGHNCMP